MFKLLCEPGSQTVGAAVAEHLVKNSHLKRIARLVCLTNNPVSTLHSQLVCPAPDLKRCLTLSAAEERDRLSIHDL